MMSTYKAAAEVVSQKELTGDLGNGGVDIHYMGRQPLLLLSLDGHTASRLQCPAYLIPYQMLALSLSGP